MPYYKDASKVHLKKYTHLSTHNNFGEIVFFLFFVFTGDYVVRATL